MKKWLLSLFLSLSFVFILYSFFMKTQNRISKPIQPLSSNEFTPQQEPPKQFPTKNRQISTSDNLVENETNLRFFESHHTKPEKSFTFDHQNLISINIDEMKNWKALNFHYALDKNNPQKPAENQIIFETKEFLYIKDPEFNIHLSNFDPEKKIILYNQNRKTIGILTGQIIVQFYEEPQISNILSEFQIEISYQDENIHLYYLKPTNPIDLQSLIVKLRKMNPLDLKIEIFEARHESK